MDALTDATIEVTSVSVELKATAVRYWTLERAFPVSSGKYTLQLKVNFQCENDVVTADILLLVPNRNDVKTTIRGNEGNIHVQLEAWIKRNVNFWRFLVGENPAGKFDATQFQQPILTQLFHSNGSTKVLNSITNNSTQTRPYNSKE